LDNVARLRSLQAGQKSEELALGNPQDRNRGHGRSSSTNTAIFGSIFVVLAVVVIVVIATLGSLGSSPLGGSIASQPVSRSLFRAVTQIPAPVFGKTGKISPGVSDQGVLVRLSTSAERSTSGGKPEIVYMGAEYCPFCAAFRWPFAIALSRFGHFTGLKETASGAHDSYPNTRTLSFYGSRYSSPYVSLSTTEFNSNICTKMVNGACSYPVLQRASAANLHLISAYDVAKYFPTAEEASGAEGGWIPFVYWAGRYVESGDFYSPNQLQGFTYADIEKALKYPSIGAGQSILQASNIDTAIICQIDGGKPGAVCESAPVRVSEAALP